MESKYDRYHIEQLEREIRQTLHKQLANVPRPFGLIFSGGFDSGLLAALTQPDFIFTIRLPFGTRYDESHYANAIIDHLGLRQRTTIIEFSEDLFRQNVEEAVKAMGEPVSHFSLVPFSVLMKTVKDRFSSMGIEPHVLSGEGPDEYLGGYARYIIFDQFNRLYSEPELINYSETVDKALGENLLKKYIDFMGYKKVYEKLDVSKLSEYPYLGKLGYMDMQSGVIEKMEQKLAKHHGVNLHYPYIEPFFAEHCYRMPDNFKVRDGVTKWAFRQVCMKYLPEIMRNRHKMGGPVAPVNHWLGGAESEFSKEVWIQHQQKILK